MTDMALAQKIETFFGKNPGGRIRLDIRGTSDIQAGVSITYHEISESQTDLLADAAEAGERPFTMGDLFRDNGQGVLVLRANNWAEDKTKNSIAYLDRFYKPA
jgi:hypothetical protein